MKQAWIAEDGKVFYDEIECLMYEGSSKMTMWNEKGCLIDEPMLAHYVRFENEAAKKAFCKICKDENGISNIAKSKELEFYFDNGECVWKEVKELRAKLRVVETIMGNDVRQLACNFSGALDCLCSAGCLRDDERAILEEVEVYLNKIANS